MDNELIAGRPLYRQYLSDDPGLRPAAILLIFWPFCRRLFRRVSRSGKPIGMFSTHYRTPGRPDDRALRLLDLLARQAADIIERVQTEERLREADQKKDEFLATLAHELRNPLAPIRNGLQIMKLAAGDTQAVEKARSIMERQVEQMIRLIDDLLDVNRIGQGKIVLQKKRISIADAVQNALDSARPLIESQQHELLVDLPSEPLLVDGDLIRLSQAFTNLLNNAAKYTNRGGRIRLIITRQGGDAVIAVEDNGVGIAAEMLPKVFDMFTQLDRSLEKSQGGLGIGLHLVKRLVEMHGGSIEAHSRGLGLGSTFTVRLPVAHLGIADESANIGAENAMPANRRRVLVLDDNADVAVSLAELLDMLGHEARMAHDGIEAVEKAEAFRPDVILMDIGMPKLSGHAACRRIRAQPWGQYVVLVACTGWGQEDDKRKAAEAGFDFHLTKPIGTADLQRVLNSCENRETVSSERHT